MGWCIQEGPGTRKAAFLITKYNAKIIDYPTFDEIDEDKALICVVENEFFDAAAYCFSENEMEEFSLVSDSRKHTWLLMDKKKVEELTGYGKAYISKGGAL